MTAEDFRLFAAKLAAIPSAATRLTFCEFLVGILQEANPRFDESKFRQAANCKVNEKGEWIS